jgi:predicted amidohydrolase YtcJ
LQRLSRSYVPNIASAAFLAGTLAVATPALSAGASEGEVSPQAVTSEADTSVTCTDSTCTETPSAAEDKNSRAPQKADTIYLNAHVQTMDNSRPTAQAIAIQGEKILAIGNNAGIKKFVGTNTKSVDLKGATVLPGFIDNHSHFLGYAGFLNEKYWTDVSSVNVYFKPPPNDPRCKTPKDPQKCFIPVQTQDDVLARIQQAARKPGAKAVYAFNYDASRLGHGRDCPGPATNVGFKCPNLQDGHARATLDQISARIPIYVSGESGHVAYTNTAALTQLNICGTDVATTGCREPITYPLQQKTLAQLGELHEELALIGDSFYVGEVFKDDPASALTTVLRTADIYASHGYTLIQEGAAGLSSAELYLAAMKVNHKFPVTVALYMYDEASKNFADTVSLAQQTKTLIAGHDDIFIAGLKSFADGGLPIYTAYLSRPYKQVFAPFNGPAFPKPYQGLADLTVGEMTQRALASHRAGYPLMIHELGDRASVMAVQAFTAAEAKAPSNFRDIVLHAPYMSAETLTKIKALNLPVSFLASDLYFWGLPLCQQVVGQEYLKTFPPYPAHSARKAGLRVTLHTDSPVTPPDPLFAIWVAKTRAVQQPSWYPNTSGCPAVFDKSESMTIQDGIKAWTVNAAYQYGLTGKMGTVTPGKLANLVFMSENPMSMEDSPNDLKRIRILGTVHKGQFKKNLRRGETPIWPGD